MNRKFLILAFRGILAFSVLVLPACDTGDIGAGGVITAASCRYDDNLSERATSFISRCRKGGIRREFPSQYNNVSLREIGRDKTDDGRKAYKLLNDGRFKK